MERVKGIEPCAQNSQIAENQHTPPDVERAYTQIRAQILDSSCPDLAKVVAGWRNLSSPLKAAILAIVVTNEDQPKVSS